MREYLVMRKRADCEVCEVIDVLHTLEAANDRVSSCLRNSHETFTDGNLSVSTWKSESMLTACVRVSHKDSWKCIYSVDYSIIEFDREDFQE
jgi:hypothetical protein